MFGQLTLARRLSLSFAVLVLLSSIGSGLGLYKMAQIQGALDEVVQVNNRKLSLLNKMSEQVHVVARVIRTLALMTEPADEQVEARTVDVARAE